MAVKQGEGKMSAGICLTALGLLMVVMLIFPDAYRVGRPPVP
jgi:hypothetical protein